VVFNKKGSLWLLFLLILYEGCFNGKIMDKHTTLLLLNTAIEAVTPGKLLKSNLSADEENIYICNKKISKVIVNRIIVIAAGKAAASMALETEKILGKFISSGICITKYGHLLPLKYLKSFEAGHPLPDKNSLVQERLYWKLHQT
jgi:glycerate 2-kinase